jgi:hypothetical protein
MDVKITLDASQLADQLSGHNLDELLSELVFKHDDLMRYAARRLVEDLDGWSSRDPEIQMQFLIEVERKFATTCKWSLIDSVISLAKNISTHKSIYWKMYHDKKHGDFFREWIDFNGIKNNYTCEFAEVSDLKEFIESKIKEMTPRSVGDMVYEKLKERR